MIFLAAVIYILLSLLVGSLLIAVSFNLINLDTAVAYIQEYVMADIYVKSGVGALGVLIIFFCLKYLQVLFRRVIKETAISFDSEEGTVDITLFALEDMLKKMLEQRKEILQVKPKIIAKKRELEVIIRGNLASEVNVLEFTKDIQRQIKEKLETILGDYKKLKVRIKIRKVMFGSKKGRLEQEPEIPFRNY